MHTIELLIAESNQVQRTLMENVAPPFLPIVEASVIKSLISMPKCTPLDVQDILYPAGNKGRVVASGFFLVFFKHSNLSCVNCLIVFC